MPLATLLGNVDGLPTFMLNHGRIVEAERGMRCITVGWRLPRSTRVQRVCPVAVAREQSGLVMWTVSLGTAEAFRLR